MRKFRLFAVFLLIVAVLVTTAFAAGSNFVPSIEQHGAPTVTGSDANGDDMLLKITPYGNRNDPDVTPEIRTMLEDAKADIDAVSNLGELKSENGTIKEDLESALSGSGYGVDDLVVTDLFDVSVIQGEVNGPITLVIANVGDVAAVLHSPAPGVWEVVPFERVGDTITITVDGLSPFALVAPSLNGAPTDDETQTDTTSPTGPSTSVPVQSPQTGETVSSIHFVAVLVLLAAAAVSFLMGKKTIVKASR